MQQPFRLPILGRPGQLHIDSTTLARIWDKTGKPTEGVCSAFLAQTFLLSPSFLRCFTEHVYRLAGVHRDIDILFGDLSVIGVATEVASDSRSERVDVFVQFGSQGILAIENKTDRATAFTDQQLHRYSQVLGGVENSVLVLLCPSDYPLCDADCPAGIVVMTYLALLGCIDEYMQHLDSFEHQYFAALRHFFRRIEVCPEGPLTNHFSAQNVGDVILCMYPSSNEGTAYEGVFVTRVDQVNYPRVTLTNFYDRRYPKCRPVKGAPQHGWFTFCETWEYSMTADAHGRLKLVCAEADMHCYASPLTLDDPRRLRVPTS
jgi:hypothetical protein